MKQCSKHVYCASGHSDERCLKVLAITANTCLTNGWNEESRVCRSGVITLSIRKRRVCLYYQAASASA